MDVFELDLEIDPIKKFLQNKLQETQSKTSDLKKKLEIYQEEKLNCQLKLQSDDGLIIDIQHTDVKVVNDKYAVWFSIKNTSCRKFESFNVMVTSPNKEAISYKYAFFKGLDAIKTNELDEDVNLVIVLKCPEYLDNLFLPISVMFICTYKENISCPKSFNVQLRADDFLNKQKVVTLSKLIDFDIKEILSTMVCFQKIELVFNFKNICKIMSSLLEIDCGFTKIDGSNKNSSSYDIFVSYNVCPVFDGTLIFLEKKNEGMFFNCRIHVKNEHELLAILHHILRNISNVAVVPKRYDFLNKSYNQESLRNQLLKELEFVEKYFKVPSAYSMADFKIKLLQLQQKADMIYTILKYSNEDI